VNEPDIDTVLPLTYKILLTFNEPDADDPVIANL
jgi:hypothetical protein